MSYKLTLNNLFFSFQTNGLPLIEDIPTTISFILPHFMVKFACLNQAKRS